MPKTGAFDYYYNEYDNWFIDNKSIYENEIAVIRSCLPPFSQGLEIGVGTGRFASPLGIATGVDPSFNMARRARDRGIHVALAAAESLPFQKNTFDLVVMVTSICFFENTRLALHEAYRVLEKGGSIIIGFIDADSTLGKKYSSEKDASRFYRDAVFYSAGTLADYAREAGFTNLECMQTLLDSRNGAAKHKKGHGEGGFVALKAHKAESQ
ncbi:MAG: class I SAM-dependent methyltransferase [Spirochaetes bacterium]|nr:class I SAM-dependent methyltransferase [Spirochaetota bacterium]